MRYVTIGFKLFSDRVRVFSPRQKAGQKRPPGSRPRVGTNYFGLEPYHATLELWQARG